MPSSRVIVVGAGIGGLVAAAELAFAGADVEVIEAATAPGGKLREVAIGDARLDAGPTVFTMRWVFDELFARMGGALSDHLGLVPATTLARHAWDADTRLDLFADIDRSADAIGDFAGAAQARRYRAFCDRSRAIYRALEQPFMRDSRPGPLSLVGRAGWRGLPALSRISPFATLWGALQREFTDPRLQQLFGRYATYCGSSPFDAPATLMLVAHVEQDGVWLVRGGMHQLARCLAALCQRLGVRIRYGEPVAEVLVRSGRAHGVRMASGATLEARAVVFNGDPAALAQGLAGASSKAAVPALPARQRSLSALTWNLVARTQGFSLARHNVFFSRDYRREFAQLVDERHLPADPTVYVCAQDRACSDEAPQGPERLLCLVNAPAIGDGAMAADTLDRCEQAAFAQLARCGLQVERSQATTVRTSPSDFHRLFPGTGGALYGRASHGWRASFARPGASTRVGGLFLAGGATHPGPGVPMAALSGQQAARAALAHLSRNNNNRMEPA